MIVARVFDGEFRIIDRIKEPVRLGGGLRESGKLSKESMEVALACTELFGQRIRDLPKGDVRVVFIDF